MATKIYLRHPETRLIKPGFYGFSWTTFFFGYWPALFRGDWKMALAIFAALLPGTTFMSAHLPDAQTAGAVLTLVVGVAWGCTYNRIYTRKLLERGYQFAGSPPIEAAQKLGVAMSIEELKPVDAAGA